MLTRRPRLDLSERPRLVTLVAPAGYGKTTTARQLARGWEDYGYCDAFGARDLAEFASRFVGALSGRDEALAARLGQQVAAIGSDEARLVETARQAWSDAPPRPSAIVIDHLESLEAIEGLRELLNWLLERPHPDRTVLLCSRVPLRLRASRFALPHETLTIGVDDLRLRLEQIRELFPVDTPESVLRAVEDVSRGWPIAVLYLVRASAEGRLPFVLRQLGETPAEGLEDYLTHEVLSRLDARERAVLQAAVAVPNLTAEDISAALDCSKREAAQLLRSTPFVSAREDVPVFEAHPLLRAIVREREEEAIAQLLRRLAARYRDRAGSLRTAELLVAAGDTRQAALALADAISSMKTTYLFRSPTPQLARVIAALSVDDLIAAPLVWNLTSLARVYTIPDTQWLDEARLVSSRLQPGTPLKVRSGVINGYANAAGNLGLFGEGRAALDAFEAALSGDERPIGQAVAELWRIVLAVWEGVRSDAELDLEGAEERLAPVITADDATLALWHFNVVARSARTSGNRAKEERYLERARAGAERVSVPLVQALVLCDQIVSAWFWGDDARFAEGIGELERAAVVSVWDGIRHFVACCRGRGPSEPLGYEHLHVRAMSFLIAAASPANEGDAVRLARLAVGAADAAASGFHQAIARVALATLSAGTLRRRLYEEALGYAQQTRSVALIDAVRAVAAGKGEAGMLTAFVARYSRRGQTRIRIDLLDLAVQREGEPVALQRREFEVLASLALQRGGVSREWLADRFWPESETADGLNTLKVYVSRLRQKLGTDVIVSTPQGYVLSSTVAVDLARIEGALGLARMAKTLDAEHVRLLESAAEKDPGALATSLASWPSLAEVLPRFESAIRDSGLALARDALAREDWPVAAAHAKRAFDRDRCDDLAAELTVRALAGLGDDLGAVRILHAHDEAMRREFGMPAAERFRSLLRLPAR